MQYPCAKAQHVHTTGGSTVRRDVYKAVLGEQRMHSLCGEIFDIGTCIQCWHRSAAAGGRPRKASRAVDLFVVRYSKHTLIYSRK